ncbi:MULTISPECIES: RNA-binding S4 domain-containing protein [Capnocytophaga]|uniref:S4 domain protein n=1 Tax=Capnocytophaga canis TaxID=1848903 RepID=A0A0B7ITN1_9FLAO|nr:MULTISPECIES: RNA-binding S4 domain-containing protein [Capnocytophaga]ATA72243.1 RNA-binding protein [Capnocytophaga sp. H4358]CEN42383.1 S4 domain protein [Capnocytophaga canis]CEN43155.1 S4 domain protein [Capnocytophaga canis]CEN53303.1 S4 domain protein [Capnocytophaga canis]
MRIDKFLWCVRYYKTRNMATEACKKGHVRINGDIAKPSREVFNADKIALRKNQITYELKVLDIPPSRVGAKLLDLYRQDLTPPEAFEHAELMKLSQEYYRKKGEGRPTKKDRRAIDSLLNDADDDDWDI